MAVCERNAPLVDSAELTTGVGSTSGGGDSDGGAASESAAASDSDSAATSGWGSTSDSEVTSVVVGSSSGEEAVGMGTGSLDGATLDGSADVVAFYGSELIIFLEREKLGIPKTCRIECKPCLG